MSSRTAETIYELVKELTPRERLRLVERIVSDLAANQADDQGAPRYAWKDIAGIAPNLMNGEDAQEWVSRSRRESDEHRERALRGQR